MAIPGWSAFERSFAGWAASGSARSTPATSRSATWRAGDAAARMRSSSRSAAAPSARPCCRPPRRAPQDGAGRPHLATAGRRTCQHRRGVAAGGIVVEPARADFTSLLRNADALDLAGGLQHHGRDPVLRRSRRAGAVRHRARDRAGGSRLALAERGMVAWCRRARCRPTSLADAVGRALAGPSISSFPPCDVDGGRRRRRRYCIACWSMSTWAGSFGRGGALARGRPHGRAVVARRRCRRCRAGARAAAGDPSRHRRAVALAVVPAHGDAGAGRPAGGRAGRRPASAWLRARQSCCGRRQQEDRAGHRAAGDAGAGRVGHRPHGARAAVRRAALAGAGAALEPHRARPGADLAGDRLRRPLDLRCTAPHASGEAGFWRSTPTST